MENVDSYRRITVEVLWPHCEKLALRSYCPTCHARPQESCKTPEGKPRAGAHSARLTQWLRAVVVKELASEI